MHHLNARQANYVNDVMPHAPTILVEYFYFLGMRKTEIYILRMNSEINSFEMRWNVYNWKEKKNT